MKNISKILTFIFVAVFSVSCSNRVETTQTDDTVLDKDASKGLFVGLIEDDSVFIKSDTIEFNWQHNLIVYLGDEILYKDTDRSFYLISPSNVKIIQLKNQKTAYILITEANPPFEDQWVILKVYNKQVKGIYTEVLKGILKDVDNDGFFEVGGVESSESPCVEDLHCDSAYYTPYKIYKLNKTFEFDSISSKKYTMDLYGTFLGFDNSFDTILYVK